MSGADAAGADRSFGQKVKHTIESKVLIPLAATVVSTAVTYLVRKLPMIIEEVVVPKLRERGAADLAQKAEDVGGVLPGGSSNGGEPQEAQTEQPQAEEPQSKEAQATEKAPKATRKSKQEAGDENEQQSEGAEATPPAKTRVSNKQREAERRKREERRRERKQTVSSA